MTKKKSGLGNRGVEFLLSSSKVNKADINNPIFDIDISLINSSPYQPRKSFDEEDLKSLIESIREQGVIQPVLIREYGNNAYELIAGERRLRAAKVLGHEKIPAIIKVLSNEAAAIYALLENVQRENLNPIEEALGFEKLIKEFNFTQEILAKKTGKSRSHIANLIRLLSLDKYVIKLLLEKKIDMGHARALLSLSPNSQKIYADRVINQNLSVRDIEKLVTEKKENHLKKTKLIKKDEQIHEIETQLCEKYGVKTELNHSVLNKSGRIIFKYSNLEVLEGLLKKLGYQK